MTIYLFWSCPGPRGWLLFGISPPSPRPARVTTLSSPSCSDLSVLIDVPLHRGFTLAHEVRDTYGCSNRPTPLICVVTAHKDTEVHQRCKDANLDSIFVKPVKKAHLQAGKSARGVRGSTCPRHRAWPPPLFRLCASVQWRPWCALTIWRPCLEH